tara:strand:- start:41 stop:343 length:303 start_codon:yes stop_codon:yes gene_type:complete
MKAPFKMKGFSGFGNLVEKAKKMSGQLTGKLASDIVEEMKTGSMAAPENKVSTTKAPSGNYLERRDKRKQRKQGKKKQFKVVPELPLYGAKQITEVNKRK